MNFRPSVRVQNCDSELDMHAATAPAVPGQTCASVRSDDAARLGARRDGVRARELDTECGGDEAGRSVAPVHAPSRTTHARSIVRTAMLRTVAIRVDQWAWYVPFHASAHVFGPM